jgi:hypothetical protein
MMSRRTVLLGGIVTEAELVIGLPLMVASENVPSIA